jgi:hypothetical protein
VQVAAATREIAIGRGHVSKFARSCTPDPHLEPPEDQGKLRRCLPNGTMANAADCCKAQAAFKARFLQIAADEKRPSLTARVDRLAMPFRAFFISTIIGTTLLLIFWQRYLEHHYQPLIEFVDLGIFLAAFTMLFAVVAEQGERLAEAVMFARSDYGVPTIFSAVLVPWSIFICLYFLQSYFAQVQSQVLKWGRVLSGVAGIAGASLLQVDNVMDVFAVVAGVAAAWFHVAGVTIAAVAIAWWMTAVSQRILRSRPVGSAA